jgi:hypothetical protein
MFFMICCSTSAISAALLGSSALGVTAQASFRNTRAGEGLHVMRG